MAASERQTAPGFSTQLLREEMRNCLPDPKPEFTAALHYGFLQEALGEAQLGKCSPVNSSCACLLHKHVGGFLPGVAGAGCGRHGAGNITAGIVVDTPVAGPSPPHPLRLAPL